MPNGLFSSPRNKGNLMKEVSFMKNTMLFGKSLLASGIFAAALLGFQSGVFAAFGDGVDSGSILIEATVAKIQKIVITDSSTVLSNLNAGLSAVTVGDIKISSNSRNGFKLTLTDANSGFLVHTDTTIAAALADEKVAYTVDLVGVGALPGGIAAPASLTGLVPVSAGLVKAWTPQTGSKVMNQYQYNVNINTAAKVLTEGSYAATLQLAITDNI